VTIRVEEDDLPRTAGDLHQPQALSTQQPFGALPLNVQRTSRRTCQVRGRLKVQGFVIEPVEGNISKGRGGELEMSLVDPGPKPVLKETLPSNNLPGQGGQHALIGCRRHFNIGTHPHQAALVTDQLLVLVQLHSQNGEVVP